MASRSGAAGRSRRLDGRPAPAPARRRPADRQYKDEARHRGASRVTFGSRLIGDKDFVADRDPTAAQRPSSGPAPWTLRSAAPRSPCAPLHRHSRFVGRNAHAWISAIPAAARPAARAPAWPPARRRSGSALPDFRRLHLGSPPPCCENVVGPSRRSAPQSGCAALPASTSTAMSARWRASVADCAWLASTIAWSRASVRRCASDHESLGDYQGRNAIACKSARAIRHRAGRGEQRAGPVRADVFRAPPAPCWRGGRCRGRKRLELNRSAFLARPARRLAPSSAREWRRRTQKHRKSHVARTPRFRHLVEDLAQGGLPCRVLEVETALTSRSAPGSRNTHPALPRRCRCRPPGRRSYAKRKLRQRQPQPSINYWLMTICFNVMSRCPVSMPSGLASRRRADRPLHRLAAPADVQHQAAHSAPPPRSGSRPGAACERQ